MIEIKDLKKSFGDTQVLKGVSFNVRPGTTRVILGLSGSGKSVLMKHMIGLMKPDSGQILMNDEDICQMDDQALLKLRTKFGMVFQQAALFDSMTVWENVAFPLLEHTKLSRKLSLPLRAWQEQPPRWPSPRTAPAGCCA